MGITSNDMIQDIVDQAWELAEVRGELLDEQEKDRPYGMHQPNDAQFIALWNSLVAANPPVPIQAPDGVVYVASPFEAFVSLADNGREWITRYKDALQREAERAQAAFQEVA